MPNNSLSNTKINITYASLLHANGVELPVTEQEDIYDGTGNKSSLKLGRSCNGATFCGPVVINGSLSANNITTTSKLSASTQFDILNLLNVIYPIGATIFTHEFTNPQSRPGWSNTTWGQISQGKYIVSIGNNTDKNGTSGSFALGDNLGEYSHQLSVPEIPFHTHQFTDAYYAEIYAGNGGYAGSNKGVDFDNGLYTRQATTAVQNGGGGGYHNNCPPSYGLWVWRRTA